MSLCSNVSTQGVHKLWLALSCKVQLGLFMARWKRGFCLGGIRELACLLGWGTGCGIVCRGLTCSRVCGAWVESLSHLVCHIHAGFVKYAGRRLIANCYFLCIWCALGTGSLGFVSFDLHVRGCRFCKLIARIPLCCGVECCGQWLAWWVVLFCCGIWKRFWRLCAWISWWLFVHAAKRR